MPRFIQTQRGTLPTWPDIASTTGLELRAELAGKSAPDWIRDLLYSEQPEHPEFAAAIPLDVLQAVRLFRCCHLPLLAKAAEDPERFLLLANQSPALAFALADAAWNSNQRVSLGPYPHRIFWLRLHHPDSNSFARAMAKIPAHLLNPFVIPTLRTRWTNNRNFRRLLRHVKVINHAVLQCLLTIEDEALGSWCLRIAETDSSSDGQTAALVRVLRAHWSLVHPDLQMDYRAINDRVGLERALHRLQFELSSDRFFLRELYTATFPDPPFQGTDEIIPLTHPEHLRKESDLQHNCAVSYLRAVYAGRAYIYTCRSRRLTILIERTSDGQWFLSAVEGPAHTQPKEEDFAFVLDWFQNVSR